MKYTPAQVRKALIAAAGFVCTVAATALAVGPEVIPAVALPYINIGLAVGTVYGVFRAPNATVGRHAK